MRRLVLSLAFVCAAPVEAAADGVPADEGRAYASREQAAPSGEGRPQASREPAAPSGEGTPDASRGQVPPGAGAARGGTPPAALRMVSEVPRWPFIAGAFGVFLIMAVLGLRRRRS